jgi:4'-phosphopantetheinyl transferase
MSGIRPGNEVRVHWFDLDAPALSPEELASFLDQSERERADRFRFPADRDRYVAGRGLLRAVLGGELNLHPGAVPLAHGPHGKPFVDAEGNGAAGPPFNASHSDRLYAVAIGGEGVTTVGLDLEVVRAIADVGGVARQVFVPEELDQVLPVRGEEGLLRFYRFWTAKEAVLKALGTGFSLEPTTLRIQPSSAASFTVHPVGAGAPELPGGGSHLEPIPVPGRRGEVAVAAVVAFPGVTSLPALLPGLPPPGDETGAGS